MNALEHKRVLVTGACGTVGAELMRQLLLARTAAPTEVIGLDNNETEIFHMDQQYLEDSRAQLYVADIRDLDELGRRMKGVDVVFHTAALKHVALCERSPDQAVQTNIVGVQNVIKAAIDNSVQLVVFTSSDKAVNPTNVMGTSKLMGERLMTAANNSQRAKGPIFTSTRFGNILGSNGSVVPIFHSQIAKGGPVTVTDRKMTRFVMSVAQAVRLVIDTCDLARGGEVFVTKMPAVNIHDLAKAMIMELAAQYRHSTDQIQIAEIGAKPGEKLYEELMNQEETRRSVELDRYFSVLPAFPGVRQDVSYDYSGAVKSTVPRPYVSADERLLSIEEIRAFLVAHGVLERPSRGL